VLAAAVTAISALTLAILFRALFVPVGSNLLVNSSFENDRGTFMPAGNSRMPLKAGDSFIPGWQVAVGEIAWSQENNPDDPVDPEIRPSHGDFFIDLTNRVVNGPYGGVMQSIWFDQDSRYEMRLDVGTSPPRFGGPVIVRVTIRGATDAAPVTHDCVSNPSGTTLKWEPCTFRFKPPKPGLGSAGTGAWTIVIQAPIRQGKAFIGIDNADLHRLSRGR
jgi:hypothetical protein